MIGLLASVCLICGSSLAAVPRHPNVIVVLTDVFFDEAIRWMRGCAERKEPFFCYLPLNAAHSPLFVPDEYREPYRGQPRNVASFFGMIANIDENIGKLDKFTTE